MRTRATLAGLGAALRSGAIAAAVALSTLAGCSSCNESALKGGDGGSSGTSLTPEQSAKVLARVGDRTITLGDYVAALEHMDQFDRLRYQSPERRKELLGEMINVALLAQEAKAKGYDKDPLAQEERRSILRDAMLAQARKGVPGPNEIPDAEVQAFFDAHRADYRDPERRRVSLIIVGDEASGKDVLDAALKATATQWGELVRKKSIDPQARANVPIDLAGDFGMVSPPGDARGDNPKVPSDVRAAAYEIPEINTVLARLVKSGSKYYVVRLTQKTQPRDRTIAEAERTIRVKLAHDKARAKEDELLASLRTQFPVQINDQALADVHLDAPLTDGGAEGGAALSDAARD